jgi:hypothetical protein
MKANPRNENETCKESRPENGGPVEDLDYIKGTGKREGHTLLKIWIVKGRV